MIIQLLMLLEKKNYIWNVDKYDWMKKKMKSKKSFVKK